MLKLSALCAAAMLLVSSLSGCSTAGESGSLSSTNCSILNDPYFSFKASTDKDADPRGYFDEVVPQQQSFLDHLKALEPIDEGESTLIGNLVSINQVLLGIYVDEQQKRTPGKTAAQFWDDMTPSERAAWQEAGKVAVSKTQEQVAALDAYAAYCGVK